MRKEKKHFNVGIMGTGNMASIMANHIMKRKFIRCIAVSSKSIERAKKFAKEKRIIHYYGSYEDMLKNERLDLVYIATRNNDHYYCLKICIENKVPVLVEKPFTMSLKETNDIIDYSNSKDCVVFEAMLHYYSEVLNKVKETLYSGKLGRPLYFFATLGIPMLTLERVRKVELGGGASLDLGVYLVALSNVLFGEIERSSIERHMSIEGVDSSNVYEIYYKNGVRSTLIDSINCSYENKGIVCCEKGHIIIHDSYNISKADIYYQNTHTVIKRFGDGYLDELTKVLSYIYSDKAFEFSKKQMEQTKINMKVLSGNVSNQ